MIFTTKRASFCLCLALVMSNIGTLAAPTPIRLMDSYSSRRDLRSVSALSRQEHDPNALSSRAVIARETLPWLFSLLQSRQDYFFDFNSTDFLESLHFDTVADGIKYHAPNLELLGDSS